MTFFTDWLQKLHETFIETQYWKLMLEGFGNTIVITLGALFIGVLIGTLIAVIKYCAEDTKALKPLAWICDLYVTVIRGVPVVVLLLIFYFIIMTSAEGITVGILTFGINSGAYMAVQLRRPRADGGGPQSWHVQIAGHAQDHLPAGAALHPARHRQRTDRPSEGDGCCGLRRRRRPDPRG